MVLGVIVSWRSVAAQKKRKPKNQKQKKTGIIISTTQMGGGGAKKFRHRNERIEWIWTFLLDSSETSAPTQINSLRRRTNANTNMEQQESIEMKPKTVFINVKMEIANGLHRIQYCAHQMKFDCNRNFRI